MSCCSSHSMALADMLVVLTLASTVAAGHGCRPSTKSVACWARHRMIRFLCGQSAGLPRRSRVPLVPRGRAGRCQVSRSSEPAWSCRDRAESLQSWSGKSAVCCVQRAKPASFGMTCSRTRPGARAVGTDTYTAQRAARWRADVQEAGAGGRHIRWDHGMGAGGRQRGTVSRHSPPRVMQSMPVQRTSRQTDSSRLCRIQHTAWCGSMAVSATGSAEGSLGLVSDKSTCDAERLSACRACQNFPHHQAKARRLPIDCCRLPMTPRTP